MIGLVILLILSLIVNLALFGTLGFLLGELDTEKCRTQIWKNQYLMEKRKWTKK